VADLMRENRLTPELIVEDLGISGKSDVK
jgi:hypothetical protein